MSDRDGKILVVDDDYLNRTILSTAVEEAGYSVKTVDDGRKALNILRSEVFDVVLLDLLMPEMDGFQVLEAMKLDDELQHIPVIVISSLDEMESIAKSIKMGAMDHLPKPFDPVLLQARLKASLVSKKMHDQEETYRQNIERVNLELEKRVISQVKEITSAQMATIFALAKLAEFRDTDTGLHLDRVREYSHMLAIQMSKLPQYSEVIDQNFIENIYTASPLHDIGKVGISDMILLKPGKLNEVEFNIMKTHTVIGGKALRDVDLLYPGNSFIKIGIEIAENHHEKYDGSGYPIGIAGQQIPISGRILAVADVYDALTTKRTYKDCYTHEESRDIIFKESGKHFDPDIIHCFIEIEKEFDGVRQRYQDQA